MKSRKISPNIVEYMQEFSNGMGRDLQLVSTLCVDDRKKLFQVGGEAVPTRGMTDYYVTHLVYSPYIAPSLGTTDNLTV